MDAPPAPDVLTFTQMTQPSFTDDGLRSPSLRFGDPRVVALLAALLGFCHLFAGFTNRQLVQLVSSLLDRPYTSRQATYDLRRLSRKGLICRTSHTHCYQLTPRGRTVATLFTKTYGRVLTPGLALLDLALPAEIAQRSPLSRSWRQLNQTLDEFIYHQLLAAA